MANEIKAYYESGLNLYAIIRNDSGQAFDITGEAFETWNAMADYDIELTDKSGSMYVGNIPDALAAGYYTLQVFQRAGESVADTDPVVSVEDGYWTGTVWYKMIKQLQDIRTDSNELQTDLTNGGRLDLLIDAIKAKTDLVPSSPAAVGSAMTLANDSVTAAALASDAVAEIWAAALSDMAAGAPSATCSVLTAINYLYEAWRNKVTVSSTEMTVHKDDGSTGLCKSSVSDSGTLYTKGEFGAV